MLFSPDALKQPQTQRNEGPLRAEKGRLVNVPRRKQAQLPVPRFLMVLLLK